MNMIKIIINYCKSRLSDSNYKPEYKEVTNVSFAKFIMDVAECIDDIIKIQTRLPRRQVWQSFI